MDLSTTRDHAQGHPHATLPPPLRPGLDAPPAVCGSTGCVQPGMAEFHDRDRRRKWTEPIGKNYRFEIRVEDGGTTCEPAGRNATDAEALRLRIMAKFLARAQCEAAGLVVIDPAAEGKKRPRLADTFEDYIEDAFSAAPSKLGIRPSSSRPSSSNSRRSSSSMRPPATASCPSIPPCASMAVRHGPSLTSGSGCNRCCAGRASTRRSSRPSSNTRKSCRPSTRPINWPGCSR